MFLSNSIHGDDPFSFDPDHPFFHDSKLEDFHPPISLFHFPSPFDDHHHEQDVSLKPLKNGQDHVLLLPGQFLDDRQDNAVPVIEKVKDLNNISIMTDSEYSNKDLVNAVPHQIPKKRSSKKDRHSKINTLRGPRDRRMRLSLPVAREFFALQDMLGVDKASKTVEWLLIQAKSAIKNLGRELNFHCSSRPKHTSSATSEGEVVSGIDEVVANNGIHQLGGRIKGSANKDKKSGTQLRKTSLHPLAKESREKARERARARTMEKAMQNRRLVLGDEPKKQLGDAITQNNDSIRMSTSWSATETGEESVTQSHNMNNSAMDFNNLEEQICSNRRVEQQLGANDEQMFDDDCLVIMGKWSPSSIFYSLQNNGIPQEHQIGDFQFFGSKPWEAYNDHSFP